MSTGLVAGLLWALSASGIPRGSPPVPAADAVVAVVSSLAAETARETVDSFRRRLEARGAQVALSIDLSAQDEPSALSALQASGAQVILAVGARAVEVAARGRPSAAIVSALTIDPANGATGHATGVALEFSIDQQAQWLRRILPGSVKRLGVVYSPGALGQSMGRIREAARASGLEIVARPVTSPADIPQALASLTGEADVLWGLPDDVVMTPETARSILLFSMRYRLPLIGLSAAWVKAGALVALDRDYADVGAQCADQALRILSGSPVASVLPERPRTVVYSVNLRTADLMRLRLSEETLRNAREVVK